jgi:hypothetical protein
MNNSKPTGGIMVMLDCWNEEQLNQMEIEYFSNSRNRITKFVILYSYILKITILSIISIFFSILFIPLSS